MSTPRGLARVPSLLRLLATYPDPALVADAVRTGPFAELRARTARIWLLHDGDLVAVAGSGHTRAEEERYALLPGALDLAVWAAVRGGRPVITHGEISHGEEAVTSDFASIDDEFWAGVLRRTDAACVVRAPIAYAGQSVGALGLICSRPWPGDHHADGTLAAVTAALGLWLTTPASGAVERAARTRARTGGLMLAFTERQRTILAMVGEGRSTPAIAHALRASESSVKHDLQQAMRAVGARTRTEAFARASALGLLP